MRPWRHRANRKRREADVAARLETLEPRVLLSANLVITEFAADNEHGLKDYAGHYHDWVELYNAGDSAVNLAGYRLADKQSDPSKWWTLPTVTVPAKGYKIIFFSGEDTVIPLPDSTLEVHSSLKLDPGGEYLGLMNPAPNNTPVFEYAPVYPQQYEDVSYGVFSSTPTQTTLIAAGATARYLAPTASNPVGDWTLPAFPDGAWSTGATGLGFEVPQTTPSLPLPGTPNFYYGQTGPGGTYNLYETVTTTRTWLAAYNDAKGRSQGGVTGHLVTITDQPEYDFVKGLLSTSHKWIGLTDSTSALFSPLGAVEYNNTSAATPLPANGTEAAAGKRGSGFVWVTGEKLKFHQRSTGVSVWDASNPDNASNQDGVLMRSDGTWRDEGNGESGQAAATSRPYIVEYDLALPAPPPPPPEPNLTVQEVRGTGISSIDLAVSLLSQGGGITYAASMVNFTDPQAPGGGRAGSDQPFGGDTGGDDDNFVLKITGRVRIPTTGNYTFDVNSDDGFRLKIIGASFTTLTNCTLYAADTVQYAGGRSAADSFAVTSLTAGEHNFELTYFENVGGAHAELFAASGSYTIWDAAAFDLVGDTTNGGLALASVGDQVTTSVQSAMYQVNSSLYARFPFSIASPASVETLKLRLKYDDGFVAYLNGVEVASSNAPADLPYNAAATADRPGGLARGFQEFDLTTFKGLLASGTNVLAIHGLNVSADNRDFLLLPELVSTTGAVDLGRRGYFVTPTPGYANSTAQSNLGPIIGQVYVPTTQPGDSQNIVVTARIAPSANPIQAGSPTLQYRVMQGNVVSLPMFDDGLHGDGAAGDGLYAATIPASASLPGEMVRWKVTAADTTGLTSRSPLFPFATESAEYYGTVIADTALTTQLPVVHWFLANPAAADDNAGTQASIYYKGRYYDNVHVEIRGGSARGWPKKHYKFKMNRGEGFVYDQNEAPVNEWNLNSSYGDKSFLRTILAWESYRDAGVEYCASFPMRVQQNDQFYSVAFFVEEPEEAYLERFGYDPTGNLYKLAQDIKGPNLAAETSKFEVKVGDTTRSDLQTMANALISYQSLTGQARINALTTYLFDNFDVPQVINSWAVNTIIQDTDDAQKNYFLYHDIHGDGLWRMFPWDKDLSFGRNYVPWAGGVLSDEIWTDMDDWKVQQVSPGRTGTSPSHPLFGSSGHAKIDGSGSWNTIMDAFLDVPLIKDMYLRRLRSVMDQLLQPSSTPAAQRYYDTRIDQLVAQMSADVALDKAKWSQYGTPQTFDEAVGVLKNTYLAGRRTHLYVDHATSTSYPDFAGIPAAQTGSPAINFGAIDYNPASTNQDQEYIQLVNPSAFAVDLSGWSLSGAVELRFPGGSVIPANGAMYVVADIAALKARTTGPRAGQGLLIVGPYDGKLSALGETIVLQDAAGQQVNSLTYTGNPTDVQRYLRITEINYNPVPPAAGSPYTDQEFEFIELKNTSATVTLNLTAGVRFTADLATGRGIQYSFAGSGVTSLLPGQYVVLAKNPAAFATRYSTAGLTLIGPYTGYLSNQGEPVRLYDAVNEQISEIQFNDGRNWPGRPDGNGSTLEVLDPLGPSNDPANWRSSSEYHGSPGRAGLEPVVDVVVNEVLTNSNPPLTDAIELYNTSDHPVDISGWFLSDAAPDYKKFQIPNGTVLAPAGQPGCHVTFDESDFNPTPLNPLPNHFALNSYRGDDVWLLRADALGSLTTFADHVEFGAALTDESFGLWPDGAGELYPMLSRTLGGANSGPRLGSLVISELMYNPPAPLGDPRAADDLEFVEICNPTTATVNVTGWRLSGGIDFAFAPGTALVSGQRRIIVPFDPSDAVKAAAFRSAYGLSAIVPLLGPYLGQLDGAGETIRLERPDVPPPQEPTFIPYVIVDAVKYDTVAPWPAGPDGTGQSLTRRAALTHPGAAASWDGNTPTPGEGRPEVTTVVINAGNAQRSNLAQVTLRFSETVTMTSLIVQQRVQDYIKLYSLADPATPIPWLDYTRFYYDPYTAWLTIDLTVDGLGGSEQTKLPDGRYELRLGTTGGMGIKDGVGLALSDSDGVTDGWLHLSASTRTNTVPVPADLFRLQGDLTGDAQVTAADRAILAAHYRAAGTVGQGDVNLDGLVNVVDLGLLTERLGQVLGSQPAPPPGPQTASGVTASVAPSSPPQLTPQAVVLPTSPVWPLVEAAAAPPLGLWDTASSPALSAFRRHDKPAAPPASTWRPVVLLSQDESEVTPLRKRRALAGVVRLV